MASSSAMVFRKMSHRILSPKIIERCAHHSRGDEMPLEWTEWTRMDPTRPTNRTCEQVLFFHLGSFDLLSPATEIRLKE